MMRNRRTVLIGVILASVSLAGTISGFIFFGDFIFHLDVHLGEIIAEYGAVTYAILFGIIFVETGLVFTPFLPGDSLLFVAGTFTALGSLNIAQLLGILMLAAIVGDTVNYWIGRFFGKQIEANSKLPINKKHLEKTRQFFNKHGGKTIILARFVPVIRTFAPFVAGAGRMRYRRFLLFNIAGGILWCTIGILAGYFFGNIPLIKNNFTISIFGIVLVSLIPMLIPVLQGIHKTSKRSTINRSVEEH